MPRKRPKANKDGDRHTQPRLAFHLPQELLDAFRSHIDRQEPRPHDSEVLRLALRRYLQAAGDWPPTGKGG